MGRGTHASGTGGPRRLNQAHLLSLPPNVATPTYARDDLRPASVHFGVGGFHRAHLAVYLDDILERRISADWSEHGVGLLPGDRRMAEALLPQDCLYTVVERGAALDAARVVGSLSGYTFAADQPWAVVDRLADPLTRIVSLTITEGGYLVDDKTGVFDAANPAVQQDVDPQAPSTVFGYIVAGLARRRAAGLAPFTVMSCDNVRANGRVARTAIVGFAGLRDAALAAWIEANVAFPNAMVDRITPQTTDADRAMVAAALDGIADAWPVVTEPFKQWVLEDTFSDGRPRFEEVGVQIVGDVHPYETMKLRLLNGSHQAMAYLGYLAGYRYAHAVMGDAHFVALLSRYMDAEVSPLLPAVPGIDLAEYKQTLLERFANPKIADTLARLATDGSDRMPKFVLPSVSEALAQGRPHRVLTLLVAAFCRYLRGVDEQQQPIVLHDTRADELCTLAVQGGADPRPLLSVRRVFGDLGENAAWVSELSQALHELDERGAAATVAALVGDA